MSVPRRHAFTLIELLTVMMIIAALMGLLIPTISLVQKRAKITRCRERLAQIQAACSLYRDVNGVYPSSPAMNADVKKDAPDGNSGELQTLLQTVAHDQFPDAKSVEDPWHQPFRYRPARLYEFDKNMTASCPVRGEDPPNIDSYQLWSVGPNGEDEIFDAKSGDGDDIANFKTNS